MEPANDAEVPSHVRAIHSPEAAARACDAVARSRAPVTATPMTSPASMLAEAVEALLYKCLVCGEPDTGYHDECCGACEGFCWCAGIAVDIRAALSSYRAAEAGVTEGELAKAMHAERLEREGCRSNYADERWDESKADRERWYASARVAMRMMGGGK